MRVIIFFLLLLFSFSCNGVEAPVSDADTISHELWDKLLKKHVDEKGWVDYKGFEKDKEILNSYLDILGKSAPNRKTWSEEEQLAFWINAYNAYTIALILEYYPIKSIKSIGSGPLITFVNSPWDIKFIEIGNKKLDLNNIEHGIIRSDFNDPRIHFALVCAARSCPELRNEAYTGERLNQQLEEEAIAFINNPTRNKISKEEVKLSQYFTWYGGDFEVNEQSIIDFINQYSRTKISKNADISYLEYNWSLNEQY
jgi:hypothetical protein